MDHHRIAAGLLWREEDLLLIQQPDMGQDPAPLYWALPAGQVEPRETFLAGLVREIQEETGLTVEPPISLCYLAEVEAPDEWLTTIMAFECHQYHGELAPQDPDGLIVSAAFVPRAEAAERISQLPLRVMHEPIVAYLEGRAEPGSYWSYQQTGETMELIARSTSIQRKS